MKRTKKSRESAKRIEHALAVGNYFLDCSDEEAITDALSDIRHLCDQYGLDFGALDKMAYTHYTEEKGTT